jgi:hypothetical protein
LGKVWVLDTETKGTGARMVPLEKVQTKPARRAGRSRFAKPRPQPGPGPAAPGPRKPRQFKVVDVMTRRVLTDGADARATLELLEEVGSVVDVQIYVWQPEAKDWRPLTLTEAKTLWKFRRSDERAMPAA